ncbi:APC family permease [Nocardia tengchongensis]|uniref:APC family permease n=1 Tax=Nocardia tengchongensis TaxID=2055889 RepID=UPI00369AD7CC
MVIAAVAPLGATAVVIPTVFALSGNASAALYFIAAAIILSLFAVGYTLTSRHVHNAGAFYTYVQAGLGKLMGAGAASLALISYAALLISLFAYFGVAASNAAMSFLGVSIDWWVFAFTAILLVAFLGYRDVEVSAKVLGVVLVLEVMAILVIDLAIVARGGASGLSVQPLDPRKILDGAPGLGLMFAFFAFFGFEATAVFRSEAKNPQRTIPRATYASVAFIGVLYAFTSWAQAMGVGPNRVAAVAAEDPAKLMPNLSAEYVGSAMSDAVQILLVTSIFACALSFHNVVARYQYNLARGGLLPTLLGEVSAKHRAPSRSSLTVTVLAGAILALLAIVGLDPVTQIYTWLSGSASLGIIVLMALTSLSVVVFHWRGGGNDPIWNSTVAPILSLIGLLLVLYLAVDNLDLLVGSGTAATIVLIALFACFFVGVTVAAINRARRPESYERMLS